MASTLVVERVQRLDDARRSLEAAKLTEKNARFLTERMADISRVVPDVLIKLYDAYNNNVKDIHDKIHKVEHFSNKIDAFEKKATSLQESLHKTEEQLETGRNTTGILTAATGAGAVGLGVAAVSAPTLVAVAPVAITAAALAATAGLGYHIYNKLTDSEKEIKETLKLPEKEKENPAKATAQSESKLADEVKEWYKTMVNSSENTTKRKHADVNAKVNPGEKTAKRKHTDVDAKEIDEVAKELFKFYTQTNQLKKDVEELYDAVKSHAETLEGRIQLYDKSSEKCGVVSTLVNAATSPLKRFGLLKEDTSDAKGNDAKRAKAEAELN